jgi:hypothetical protein
MTDPFTIERFLPHVGEVFQLRSSDGAEVSVLLTEIARLKPDESRPRSRDPFSLVFHAAPGSRLEQQLYRVDNPALEPFECFLVPIGPDQNGLRLEAIYT